MTHADYWQTIVYRLLTGQPNLLRYLAIPGVLR